MSNSTHDWPLKQMEAGATINVEARGGITRMRILRYSHNYAHRRGWKVSCRTLRSKPHAVIAVTRLS